MNRDIIELRVRDILAQKGMTLTSLAEKMGISLQYASNIVNNRKSLSLNALLKLADALNVPFGDLFASSFTPDASPGGNGFEAVVRCGAGTFTADSPSSLRRIADILSPTRPDSLSLMMRMLERRLSFPSESDRGIVSELIAGISKCMGPDEWHRYFRGTLRRLLPEGFSPDYDYLSEFIPEAELDGLRRSLQ